MIRILGFLLVVIGIVAVGLWVATIEGTTTVGVGDSRIDGATAAFVAVGLVAAFLLVFGTTIFSWLAGLPGRLRGRRRARQQARGMTALTRGLEAVAAGDAEDAQHHARLAGRNLTGAPGLTRLLTAQAAQLAGDDQTARESYAAMLEAPETEFLGLRGLYLQAMARDDKEEAKAYADRAFRLRPGAPWAFDSVYGLSIDRGAWGEAREALRLAQRQGAQGTQDAARKEAALLTAAAYADRDAGQDDAALDEATAALKADAGLAPAAVLAAQLQARAGRRAKAGRILDAAWSRAPHPALARTLREIFEDAPPARLAARLRKLVRGDDSDEARLVLAEAHLLLDENEEAITTLEPLLRGQPTARTFSLMAEAVEAARGKAAAEPWLERAADAPRDPVPGADGSFSLTTEGWQRLVLEYGEHGRLAPPPLEQVETAVPEEELLRLMAPPRPEPEPEVDPDAKVTEAVTEPSDAAVVVETTQAEASVSEGGTAPVEATVVTVEPADETPPQKPTSA